MAAIYIHQYTSPLIWKSLLTKPPYSYSSLGASVFNSLFRMLPKQLEALGKIKNIKMKFSISLSNTGEG